MPARNAIVLRTDQAADGRRDTEGGEVVARDEQPAGFRAPTLVRDMHRSSRARPAGGRRLRAARDPGTTGN